MPSASPMPVSSEPGIETFPVTDYDILFVSGQKYACTLQDAVDQLTTSDTHLVIDFAAPPEHVEIRHDQIAMLTRRQRLQRRRLDAPKPGTVVHGR